MKISSITEKKISLLVAETKKTKTQIVKDACFWFAVNGTQVVPEFGPDIRRDVQLSWRIDPALEKSLEKSAKKWGLSYSHFVIMNIHTYAKYEGFREENIHINSISNEFKTDVYNILKSITLLLEESKVLDNARAIQINKDIDKLMDMLEG